MSEIVRRSRHNWTIVTNRYDADATFENLRNARVVELPRVSVKRSFLHVASAGWRMLSQKLNLEKQDALVVFCEGLGDMLLFRNHEIPVICFCLTPLRAAFDDSYQQEYLRMHRNQWHRRVALKLGGMAFRALDRRAWRHYTHVFAISEEVKRRIVKGNLYPAEKISLIHPGIDLAQLNPTGGVHEELSSEWADHVDEEHRVGDRRIPAFQSRRPDLRDFTLTIAGFVDEKSRPYIEKLRKRAAGCTQDKIRRIATG